MKLLSALIVILLGAVASEPSLGRGGQMQSFGRPVSPMFPAGHFHSLARPASPMFPGGQFHSFARRASPMFPADQFHSFGRPGFVGVHNGSFHHQFHSRVVIIGAPFYAPYYYPYPYSYPYPYYYPPVAMQYAPPAYVDQGESGMTEAYWYYCASANAYYPHVRECPEGWQRVAPQPPPQSGY